MTARALASTTGLALNNSEALGALTADAISEGDIAAGRYDGAEVTTWLVRWDDPEARSLRFAGTIGHITRASGGFRAELNGLTEALNQPQGRSYLVSCSAVLGDKGCRFNLNDTAFTAATPVHTAEEGREFAFSGLGEFNDRWFEDGFLDVESGDAVGLRGIIKSDRQVDGLRVIGLWQPIGSVVRAGDLIRLTAGCDKRAETCREKFANILNFQGFPDIPGEDWLVAVPRAEGNNTGSSRRQQ
jgi:uncharacterized phage protein (TIGR02218 family)